MPKAYAAVAAQHPGIEFTEGDVFSWNPNTNTVTFPSAKMDDKGFLFGLFHEIAHAKLKHFGFSNDIELVKMERDAWVLAGKLVREYGETLDSEHVEQCLDSYRDWLYARSKCPQCELVGIQTDKNHYSCIHCSLTWKVPASRMCTVKRKVLVSNHSKHSR